MALKKKRKPGPAKMPQRRKWPWVLGGFIVLTVLGARRSGGDELLSDAVRQESKDGSEPLI